VVFPTRIEQPDKRIRAKSLKLFGAGEGNPTLVFSLEGIRHQLFTRNISLHSDKLYQTHALISNGFFALSEWSPRNTRAGGRAGPRYIHTITK
jgi:hypothetical protein